MINIIKTIARIPFLKQINDKPLRDDVIIIGNDYKNLSDQKLMDMYKYHKNIENFREYIRIKKTLEDRGYSINEE